MFFKGKATYCPTIYWMVNGEVELRSDSNSQPSSEDVSSILFADRHVNDNSSSYWSDVESKATLVSSSSTTGSITTRPSLSETLRRGDYHNSLVKSIKNRLYRESSLKASSTSHSSTDQEDHQQYQQPQMARMGYLVENSEGQKGVLVVCNLFEESLSNGCSELEVSLVTRRSQIQPGQVLYAPKVKVYRQEMADDNSIQFFIVARYVKLVPQKSAIYQFFESMNFNDGMIIQHDIVNSKKRTYTDASTQFSNDKEKAKQNQEEQSKPPLRRKKPVGTTDQSKEMLPQKADEKKKEHYRKRIKAIKKKIMVKKVEEKKVVPPFMRIKTETKADSVIFDSGTPSFFNNGFISEVVVISDDEEEEPATEQAQQANMVQSMTPPICSETPILPSVSMVNVKRDLTTTDENEEINLSSHSPITLSMLYSTANQLREMCSILDKSPLMEFSQKEENERVLTSDFNENNLFTQEQLIPQVVEETSSSSGSRSENTSDRTSPTSPPFIPDSVVESTSENLTAKSPTLDNSMVKKEEPNTCDETSQ